MKLLRALVAWLGAFFVLLVHWTARVRWHGDPRSRLRDQAQGYAYAILHCHQITAVACAEPGTGAMVSRSADGDLLVPSLLVRRAVPVRGSTSRRGQDKGGATALARLVEHVRGGAPAYFAVDGPRGPRNRVNRGVGILCQNTGAVALAVLPLARSRWILSRTWDRLQIPRPFARIDVYFGPPLACGAEESVEAFCQRVEDALVALEEEHDPAEAAAGREAAARRKAKLAREAQGSPLQECATHRNL